MVSNFTSACCTSRLARGNAEEQTHSETSSNYLCTNAGRAAICQGAQQGSGGPSGTTDDPMHVNVTNQPTPGQGGATSAANLTASMGAGIGALA
jgi:hypothetical protein